MKQKTGTENMCVLCFFSFLAKRGVKEEIQSFDARKITPAIRKDVEDMLRKNGNSFEPKVCLCVGGGAWACAICHFLFWNRLVLRQN
jgi:hypothetical protein